MITPPLPDPKSELTLACVFRVPSVPSVPLEAPHPASRAPGKPCNSWVLRMQRFISILLAETPVRTQLRSSPELVQKNWTAAATKKAATLAPMTTCPPAIGDRFLFRGFVLSLLCLLVGCGGGTTDGEGGAGSGGSGTSGR